MSIIVCAPCWDHYQDTGPCDEGKPVNSPHRRGYPLPQPGIYQAIASGGQRAAVCVVCKHWPHEIDCTARPQVEARDSVYLWSFLAYLPVPGCDRWQSITVPCNLTGRFDRYAEGRLRSVEVEFSGARAFISADALLKSDVDRDDVERALLECAGAE